MFGTFLKRAACLAANLFSSSSRQEKKCFIILSLSTSFLDWNSFLCSSPSSHRHEVSFGRPWMWLRHTSSVLVCIHHLLHIFNIFMRHIFLFNIFFSLCDSKFAVTLDGSWTFIQVKIEWWFKVTKWRYWSVRHWWHIHAYSSEMQIGLMCWWC